MQHQAAPWNTCHAAAPSMPARACTQTGMPRLVLAPALPAPRTFMIWDTSIVSVWMVRRTSTDGLSTSLQLNTVYSPPFMCTMSLSSR